MMKTIFLRTKRKTKKDQNLHADLNDPRVLTVFAQALVDYFPKIWESVKHFFPGIDWPLIHINGITYIIIILIS